jgi:hypothetical protein
MYLGYNKPRDNSQSIQNDHFDNRGTAEIPPPFFKRNNVGESTELKNTSFSAGLKMLADLMRAYADITDSLAETDVDFDTADPELLELAEKLDARDSLIKQIDTVKSDIYSALYEMSEAQSGLYSNMLNGSGIPGSLSSEEQAVFSIITEINTEKANILKQDAKINELMTVRNKDLRIKMQELKDDKQKLKFMQSMSAERRENGIKV